MNFFVFSRKQFWFYLSCVALSVLIVISFLSFAINAKTASQNKKRLPIYSVETEEKVMAITLDCAWENSDTEELLSIFDKYNVKSTFFTTGDWCNRYEEDVKKIVEKGHRIENHSYSHPHVATIERQKLIDDTQKCNEIIESLTKRAPILYRAPYGEYSNKMLEVIEDTLSLKVIQWDVDSRDWQGKTVDEMVNTICSRAKNGSILLFHNDTKNTPQALEIIINRLQGEGYSFVLIEDMIMFEEYTLNHEGRQVKEVL